MHTKHWPIVFVRQCGICMLTQHGVCRAPDAFCLPAAAVCPRRSCRIRLTHPAKGTSVCLCLWGTLQQMGGGCEALWLLCSPAMNNRWVLAHIRISEAFFFLIHKEQRKHPLSRRLVGGHSRMCKNVPCKNSTMYAEEERTGDTFPWRQQSKRNDGPAEVRLQTHEFCVIVKCTFSFNETTKCTKSFRYLLRGLKTCRMGLDEDAKCWSLMIFWPHWIYYDIKFNCNIQ